MKRKLIILFTIITMLFVSVPTVPVRADVGGVNTDNYREDFSHSILRFNFVFGIQTKTSDTSSYIIYYRIRATAFYIGNGYFVTAAHALNYTDVKENETVIDKRYSATLTGYDEYDEETELDEYPLKIVSYDSSLDVAVMRAKDVDDVKELIPLKIYGGKETDLYNKQTFNISFPANESLTYKEYLIIQKQDVDEGKSDKTTQRVTDTFMLNNSAIGGQSGSPVLDEKHRVVGVLICTNSVFSWCSSYTNIQKLLKDVDTGIITARAIGIEAVGILNK